MTGNNLPISPSTSSTKLWSGYPSGITTAARVQTAGTTSSGSERSSSTGWTRNTASGLRASACRESGTRPTRPSWAQPERWSSSASATCAGADQAPATTPDREARHGTRSPRVRVAVVESAPLPAILRLLLPGASRSRPHVLCPPHPRPGAGHPENQIARPISRAGVHVTAAATDLRQPASVDGAAAREAGIDRAAQIDRTGRLRAAERQGRQTRVPARC